MYIKRIVACTEDSIEIEYYHPITGKLIIEEIALIHNADNMHFFENTESVEIGFIRLQQNIDQHGTWRE